MEFRPLVDMNIAGFLIPFMTVVITIVFSDDSSKSIIFADMQQNADTWI